MPPTSSSSRLFASKGPSSSILTIVITSSCEVSEAGPPARSPLDSSWLLAGGGGGAGGGSGADGFGAGVGGGGGFGLGPAAGAAVVCTAGGAASARIGGASSMDDGKSSSTEGKGVMKLVPRFAINKSSSGSCP